jgi:Transglycosylase SLT domain
VPARLGLRSAARTASRRTARPELSVISASALQAANSLSMVLASLPTHSISTSSDLGAADSVPVDVDVPRSAAARMREDLAAIQELRPSYSFWRHVFTIPDGAVVFGSAVDGRLLATFPVKGDWSAAGAWSDSSLAGTLDDAALPVDLSERRDAVAQRITTVSGPVINNLSRGLFVLPNAARYGAFLDEWKAIYERFGVPGNLGLAQALVESGLNGTARSEAGAVGFCQWMRGNWRRLQSLAPYPIDAQNQTTQAAYCAAYLSILGTKYGSFIPALSEHHAGGVNVGRVLINGEWLGGQAIRERYFLGSDFIHDLRTVAPGTYSDVYGTYGPRSFRYAEMIFGNTETVAQLASVIPQQQVFAIRSSRARTLAEIASAARIPTDEVRRFNPSLGSRIAAGTTIYLPRFLATLGSDASFWHRPPTDTYAAALDDFLAIAVPLDEWDSADFDDVLERFRERFTGSQSEEGRVMATVLRYVLAERHDSGHGAMLQEFRASTRIQQMFEEARQARDTFERSGAALPHTD